LTKGLVIDVNKCFYCGTCMIACKDEHYDNTYLPYTKDQPELGHFWMRVNPIERGKAPKVRLDAMPTPCMHCDDAPCMKAAKGGAIYKRPDGIVIIDPFKSVGQKDIVASCPYGVIYWNDKLNIPQKCTLCAHRVDAGKQPKCVLSCPSSAITYGEFETLMNTAGAEPLHPEYGAKPRVYYLGLPRTFIAGKVLDSKGECLPDADVTAKDTAAAKVVASAKSDYLGDFWLDGLDAKKTYEVAVSAAGKTKTVSVSLDKDTDLGDIQL
jgi:Fe-S-cluster-containing dehydrogenase component